VQRQTTNEGFFLSDIYPVNRYLTCGLILFIAVLAAPFAAAEPRLPTSDDVTFFREKVYPVLSSHCLKCHGGEKIKGGLDLTRRASLLKGGDSGPSLQVNNQTDPEKSHLLEMVSYRDADHEMPPAGKLSDAELATLREWVVRGAPYDPALEKPDATSSSSPKESPAHEWWAYLPLSHPAPPEGIAPHPVDRFINARLNEAGLHPASIANKTQLIRRATYDLIGLPPTPAEVDAFVADQAPDAWPRLIERLLASPHYGEKWARHWMDVIRYAETEGFEYDGNKDNIWRFRDYLIDAFNDDIPYERFVTEQIAGDEIIPPTRQSLTATGFFRVMQCDISPPDAMLAKYDVLADIVQVTGEAFLGMSLGCARCHDHKKDPLTQRDYYSFMSFFHGIRDYAISRNKPVVWADASDRDRLEKERTAKIAALDAKHARLSEVLTHATSDMEPIKDQPALIEPTAGKENAWSFVTSEPPSNWQAENFDPVDWKTEGTPDVAPGKPVWLRALFGVAEVPKVLHLDLAYAGDTEIFINGAVAFDGNSLPTGRRIIDLPPKAINQLHTGTNLVCIKTLRTTNDPPFPALRKGLSPHLRREGHLKKLGADALRIVNKEAGGDLLNLLKTNRTAWLDEAQREVGTPLSAVTEIAVPAQLHIHRRGNPAAKGDPVHPAYPAVLETATGQPSSAKVQRPDGQSSSGRRTTLAKWMTDPKNPLLWRVAVNRIWQHHFGRGIVASSTDFGRLGDQPSHPELLDWLARTFIKQGGSHKAMHRLIMTSHAYQRTATAPPEHGSKDPENVLLGRFPMRRLTAEEIRDSVLSVAGNLQTEIHGPPVHPPLPEEVLQTQSVPGRGWPKQTTTETSRRTIYVHVKRSLSLPLLAEHDQAPTDTPCAMRFVSTVPTQALGLLNSAFMDEHAALLAARLSKEAGQDTESAIRHGLKLALQREPHASEVLSLRKAHTAFIKEAGLSADDALRRIALILLNLNEFIYIE
jgi:mono/diheme cytochrome c family protein